MKKLLIYLLAVILILQLALPVSFAGKLSTSALGAGDADTGGMQYANWYFNQNNLKEVNVVIEIKNDLSTEDGLYFQAYDGYINGQMFYFGLQTRTGKPGYGLTGKGLIFSEFGTTDNANIKTALGGWYEVGTYEGPFISTRIGYDWTNHKYILTIKYKESDTIGDWYEFWIEDLTANSKTYAGALRFPFPQAPSKKGITDGGGTWTELYYRKVQGSPLPEWSVSILEVSAVSKDGTMLFPKTAHLKNAGNFYHIDQAFYTKNNRLDFVIGGSATKNFDEKNITLGSGTININVTLNGSPWNGTLDFTLKREKTNTYTAAPLNLSDYSIGTYTIQYNSSGPTNATLSSITPSSTQTLTSGSIVTFTMNFTTQKLNLLYLIVLANSSLKDTVQDFVKFKESQGFDVIVEDVPTIEQNYQGIDRAEKIRNYLKSIYSSQNIKYLLLVGDPYNPSAQTSKSTGGEVPMRYCYPDPTNHTFKGGGDFQGEVPTDFYYADLTGEWDSDKDDYFGEYQQDKVDFQAEIAVGRIPFDDSKTIKSILTNSMNFERLPKETKNKVLLAASIWGHKTNNCNKLDSAYLTESMWNDFLKGKGFQRTTLYEKEGIDSSTFGSDYPLNRENLTKLLSQNNYGISIITTGSGSVDEIDKHIWYKDNNGDGFYQSDEGKYIGLLLPEDIRQLASRTPSIFVVDSYCFSSPDSDDESIAKLLLNVNAVSIIGESRSSWGRCGWENKNDGGIHSILYFFMKEFADNISLGKSLYDSLYYYSTHFMWWEWKSWKNLFNNACLYGDPSLSFFTELPSDITPPRLIVNEPQAFQEVYTQFVTVKGQTEKDTKVKINGVDIALNPDYSFSYTLSLTNTGLNTIEVIAEDPAGNKTVVSIPVNYILKYFTITTSTGLGGSITPSGIINVEYGSNKTFYITPSSGYKIKDVKVDGISVGAVSSYTFNNITSNHIIEVICEKEAIVIILQIGSPYMSVNGFSQEIDPGRGTSPVIKNGRTLVPIRAIVEALGGTIEWIDETKTVDIKLGSNFMRLQIGNANALVNGENKLIDPQNLKVVPEIINGRTMIPLRFVSENLGCTVDWDGTRNTITITYTGG